VSCRDSSMVIGGGGDCGANGVISASFPQNDTTWTAQCSPSYSYASNTANSYSIFSSTPNSIYVMCVTNGNCVAQTQGSY
jgi:hypothetical protein